jgi:rhodanese-related sulfurtransferase
MSSFRTCPLCCCLCILLVSAAGSAAEEPFQTPAISPEEVHERQADGETLLMIVDVREQGEYKSGHLPGAINISHQKLERELDRLLGASGVVLYCINGSRTRLAEQTLIEHDVPNVYHLEGGLMGWRKAGYQVHTGWGP